MCCQTNDFSHKIKNLIKLLVIESANNFILERRRFSLSTLLQLNSR